jgi:hypothetical protein
LVIFLWWLMCTFLVRYVQYLQAKKSGVLAVWAIITSCRNTELMSRPCHSSSGAWKSSNISVQLAVCYSCCSVLVCPKKQWLVSLKAATAHRTVSLSLCTGHCCSWWQLSSAWQWKFCLLMYPETCMYVSPEEGNWFILHPFLFSRTCLKIICGYFVTVAQFLNAKTLKGWKFKYCGL